jgi:hypothetical protein
VRMDIDPAIALEILPEKIRLTKRSLCDIALDISCLQAVPDHSDQQVKDLEKAWRVHKALLVEYENRLAAIQKAAQGETEPPAIAEAPAVAAADGAGNGAQPVRDHAERRRRTAG